MTIGVLALGRADRDAQPAGRPAADPPVNGSRPPAVEVVVIDVVGSASPSRRPEAPNACTDEDAIMVARHSACPSRLLLAQGIHDTRSTPRGDGGGQPAAVDLPLVLISLFVAGRVLRSPICCCSACHRHEESPAHCRREHARRRHPGASRRLRPRSASSPWSPRCGSASRFGARSTAADHLPCRTWVRQAVRLRTRARPPRPASRSRPCRRCSRRCRATCRSGSPTRATSVYWATMIAQRLPPGPGLVIATSRAPRGRRRGRPRGRARWATIVRPGPPGPSSPSTCSS